MRLTSGHLSSKSNGDPLSSNADRVFRAFADRTRLRILHLLLDGELCVCHIVTSLRIPQPKASRHLAYLHRAGLVRVRKKGLWCYYSLAPAESPFHKKLLACLACCFEEVPQAAADARRAQALRESEAACCNSVKGESHVAGRC
jgi:ArsR family transcriptional regulator